MSGGTGSSLSGGCQCGAVRFSVGTEGLGTASICHCRMCQKAFGNYFAPLVAVGKAAFEWTRGKPATFVSSSVVTRGFCRACGTPLTYDAPDGGGLALAIGAFDTPDALPPTIQYGTEARLECFATLPELPARATDDDPEAVAFFAGMENHQHPDHDTANWPNKGDDA